jgi:hypothetical protein
MKPQANLSSVGPQNFDGLSNIDTVAPINAKLNDLITCRYLPIHPKHRDPQMMRNFTRMVIIGNDDWLVRWRRTEAQGRATIGASIRGRAMS